jgi:hypothetical protein
MPQYDLRAVDGSLPRHLGSFEASDLDQAIALSLIRQERRDSELSCNDAPLARISHDGRVDRMEEPETT